MSHNPEQASLADVLEDVVTVFEAPNTARLHGAAVRRGRQIKRRRTGAAVAGSTMALGTAGVLTFALTAAPSHGTAVAAASSGAPSAKVVSPSPSYTRPTAAPIIRSGEITGSVINDALEYALPPDSQVEMPVGGFGPVNVEVVDPTSHTWYVQTAFVIKSNGPIGTSVAISVMHTAQADTCSSLNRVSGNGKGTCTQSTVAGGKLLDEAVPSGVLDNNGVHDFVEWFSPTGYETYVQLQDSTADDVALTEAQTEAILTNQIFGEIAQALPADACVGGTFSNSVDPPSPGDSPLQHVRCSSDGNLYPSY